MKKSDPLFTLHLPGQCPPGKSQQGRRADGSTYPKSKQFSEWVARQKDVNPYPRAFQAGRFLMRVRYTPGDLRPRNVAGMQDAIMHYLENGGKAPRKKVIRDVWKKRKRWIGDDEMIVDVDWKTLPLDRKNPKVLVEVWTL